MKDIFKEMEDLRTRLDELSAYAEKECKKPKMFPQEGETYWYYNDFGIVYCPIAADLNARLNAYRTKEEPIKARDIQWAKQRVAHAIVVENEGCVPDWKTDNNSKHSIVLVYGRLEIDYHFRTKMQPDCMYMKSRKVAEKILAEHEADLLLILGE